jgi:hypothetical protein
MATRAKETVVMKRKLYLLALLLVLAAPLAAGASICEDINDMANGWDQMAEGIDELDLRDLTQRDADEIDGAIEEAFDATREFADLLEDEGNGREQRLGGRLNRALDHLYDAETIDDTVDAIDDVVDALDNITDYCDEE